MKKRIIGIDVARAFAVVGMIIVNYKIVFGEEGSPWVQGLLKVVDGKAAATFVVLAGIGLALMTNSALRNGDQAKLQTSRLRIIKRAIFLFVIGLSYVWIWPADILHFYGVYMLLTLIFIYQKPSVLLWGAGLLILAFPVLAFLIPYETGWDFSIYSYEDFWTMNGFFRNLFFNGFHPVIPWTAFMLFGLWYGRQDLFNQQFLRRSLRIGLITFISIQLFALGSNWLLTQANGPAEAEWSTFLATIPMPPMPLYMINGISFAVVIIASCILWAQKREDSKIIHALNKMGQLALTFYVAHVILGMGLVEIFGTK